jgi:hypothetical protein
MGIIKGSSDMKNAILVLSFLLSIAGCVEDPTPVDPAVAERLRINAVNDSIVAKARPLIQTGDLVLRTGVDFSSEQVKDLSLTDKTYSHGGIALVENDSIYIYHVEPDYYYITDKVRKEPLDSFVNPQKNYGIGIARYNLSDEEKGKLITYFEEQYQKKIPFDVRFLLSTNDSMYCSEMIKKGLALATTNRINIATLRFNDPRKFRLIKRYFKIQEKDFVNREIIPIDHLYLNKECVLLKRYLFLK